MQTYKRADRLTTSDRIQAWGRQHIVTADPTPVTSTREHAEERVEVPLLDVHSGERTVMDSRADDQLLIDTSELYDLGAHVAAHRQAQSAAEDALAALKTCVRVVVADGMTEVEAARQVGVTRMTIRAWLGK
jgi:hypothetical protein